MDAKLKAKWIKALRSGKYKQGRGTYYNRQTGRYCCLGVLAAVDQNRAGKNLGPVGPSERKTGLPENTDLINMNDNGRRFTTIANWIEKNL